MQNLIKQMINNLYCDSSGKSQSGTNQQDFLLKAILTELQERQEDYAKLKEAIDRLEVCAICMHHFSIIRNFQRTNFSIILLMR